VARALGDGDIRGALESTDAPALASEISGLSERAVNGVRGLLSRCGAELAPVPAVQLGRLGLLT
jgi:hypothetical protein